MHVLIEKILNYKKMLAIYLLPIVIGGAAIAYYIYESRYVSTDDANISAHVIYISPEVSGKITSIHVRENELVQKGQILMTIDDTEYLINVKQERAHLEEVRNNIETMKSAYAQNIDQIRLAIVNKNYTERQFERVSKLTKYKVDTAAQLDTAKNTLENAKYNILILEQQQKALILDLAGNPNIKVEDHPLYVEAKAQLEQAELNLSRTQILAPHDGIVSQINSQYIGTYAQAGLSLFSIMVLENIWVTTNLKETALTYVRSGQKATITVDAYPNMVFEGVVEGIGAATGAVFSILPPQNATGNWVKVTQRLPVHISIKQPDNTFPLKAGMSAEVRIDLRSLPIEHKK